MFSKACGTTGDDIRSLLVLSAFERCVLWRWFWSAPVVETLTALLAVPSGHDHALEQGWRGEAAFLELVEHDVRDVVGGVESDKIEECEWTHRVAAAEFHRQSDIGDRANSFFVSANRVE